MCNLAQAVAYDLANSSIYELTKLSVTPNGNGVTISGPLSRFYYRQLAIKHAKLHVENVGLINDQTKVQWSTD